MTRRCTAAVSTVETLPGHSPELQIVQSLHAIAEVDQQLIGGLQADQTSARVLGVEHDVHNDDRDDRETKDVKPTAVLGA